MFDGLQHGKKWPTDIDFCLEVSNTILVIGEGKEQGKPVPSGQTLAFTRIVDAWQKSGPNKFAWYLEIQHPEQDGDIKIANCDVVRYYYLNRWAKSKGNVKDFLATIGGYVCRELKDDKFNWLYNLED